MSFGDRSLKFHFYEYRTFRSVNYFAFVTFETRDVIDFLKLLIKLNLQENMMFSSTTYHALIILTHVELGAIDYDYFEQKLCYMSFVKHTFIYPTYYTVFLAF